MKMLKMAFVAAMFSLLVLSSCKEDDDPAPTPTVTANAGPDRKIQVGQTITLDGSASKDSQGLGLTYTWSVVRKPVGSNPVITTPDVVNPVFAPDLEGVYELALTVSNDHGTHTDNVVITVEYTPIVLTNITSRTVLEDRIANSDIADYWVNDDISVDAELIVKPGVVIAFAQDAAMFVNDDGSISVKGEADRKIILRGKVNQQGYWRGILVYSNSNANEFVNAEILNAGSSIMVSNIAANITVADHGKLSIRNTKVAGSKGYGVHFMDGSVIAGFEANIISHNDEAPVLLLANHVSKMDAATSFSEGNARNVIEVTGSSLTGNSEVTWTAFNDQTPYRFIGTVAVQTGLRLSAGVIIEVSPDDYFEIGEGYLRAVGTAEKKIIITGVDKTESSWNGIVFYSRSNSNILEHVKVGYAGKSELISGAAAAIILTNSSRLSIKNSTIHHSGGYGIFINGDNVLLNDDAATANEFISIADSNVLYKS